MQQDAAQVNNKKLYVGNLPYSTTEDELRNIFSEFGEVISVSLIVDKMSGRSKGFGFVEYATDEEAQAAIEGMNGTEMQGRALVVNIARPPQPREDRRSGGGGGFRPRYNNNRGDRNDRYDRAA